MNTVTDRPLSTASSTVILGKHCNHPGCGVALFPHNRAGNRLLCIPHGRAHERARYRLKMGQGLRAPDTARQGVHAAVSAFLSTPTNLDLRANIETALKVFEIRWYLDALAKQEPTEFVTIGLDKGTTHRVDLTPTIPNPDHLLVGRSTYGV